VVRVSAASEADPLAIVKFDDEHEPAEVRARLRAESAPAESVPAEYAGVPWGRDQLGRLPWEIPPRLQLPVDVVAEARYRTDRFVTS
jgi:hypothetical protein